MYFFAFPTLYLLLKRMSKLLIEKYNKPGTSLRIFFYIDQDNLVGKHLSYH